MAGLPQKVKRASEYRGVVFWLLLLGSWQFLAAPGGRNAVFGAVGSAIFVVFACWNLGKLKGLGLAYACWQPTTGAAWLIAPLSGFIAGGAVFGIGSAGGQIMILSDDWRFIVLQLTLGPVLEEVVFRGYLFALLTWLLRRIEVDRVLNWLVIVTAAVVFALVHLAQPGVGWLHLACITSTGTLYGWVRQRSGSTALSAACHAVYNLTLYAADNIVAAAR